VVLRSSIGSKITGSRNSQAHLLKNFADRSIDSSWSASEYTPQCHWELCALWQPQSDARVQSLQRSYPSQFKQGKENQCGLPFKKAAHRNQANAEGVYLSPGEDSFFIT
jgi:hypothetical protein